MVRLPWQRDDGSEDRRARHAAADALVGHDGGWDPARAAAFVAPSRMEPSRMEAPRPAPHRAAPPAAPSPARATSLAPLVIGDGISPFDPKPPPYDVYQPDIVADGWSTPDMTVRLASVRGYSHRFRGTPRQDDAVVVYLPDPGAIVFAVADGVGSGRYSHLAASVAGKVAVESVGWNLAQRDEIDWAGAVDRAADAVSRRASRLTDPPLDQEAARSMMSTTLVLGVAWPDAGGLDVLMAQVGDSSAWVLERDEFRCVLVPKNQPDSVVLSSAVASLPPAPAHVAPVRVHVPPDAVLIVGTDGLGDPLGGGGGAVGREFAEMLRTPPPVLALVHTLDFSRETFDDDRTLLAIWPIGRARR